jgi:polyisoprenoid-binding protein YceI
MLSDKLLDVANFPNISIRSRSWPGEPDEVSVSAEITVRDQTYKLDIPASVSVTEKQIIVTGNFAVTHGQLGLKPYTKFLGGLRVSEEMRIKFRITASRLTD